MIEHSTVKRWFLDTVNSTGDSRLLSERDRDYYDGKQHTAAEEAELKRRKQPIITKNRIKRKIDAAIGLEVKGRVDIKAFPRNPEDEELSEAATDALRYIADNSDFDQVKTECAFNLFIEGTCAAIVEVEKGKHGFEIMPRHIPWDRFFIDPHASRKDGADAKFMGQAIWMDAEEAKSLFKGVDPSVVTAGLEDEGGADTYDDKPKNIFFDQGRERVKIIEMFYHDDGQWMHTIFTGEGELVPARVSPYLDDDGDPCNPIEVQRAYVDRDNNPYGPVREFISTQDEINKRSSKSLHLLSVRQVIADNGAVDNVNKARLELNKPDGWISKHKGFELAIQNTSDLAAGQFNLLQEAKAEIDSMGANDAVTGKEDRNMSGRAMQVRAQAGAVELAPIMDGLRSWEKRIYRQMWARIKQFWTEEKWIRITDDEKNVKFVGLNQPVTHRQLLEQRGTPYDVFDPRLDEVAEVKNQVGELDVDIILDVMPDTVSLQYETFDAMMTAIQASGQPVPLEMMIELMPGVPNKRELLAKISGGDDPERQQAMQQQQQQEQQMRMEDRQAELNKTIADTEKASAGAKKDLADAEAQIIENQAVKLGISQLMERISGQA